MIKAIKFYFRKREISKFSKKLAEEYVQELISPTEATDKEKELVFVQAGWKSLIGMS